MNKEKQKDFARRVSQANKTQLVAVTFDIIVEYIDEACKKLETGDIPEYRTELKSAQRFLSELMSALDYNYPIAMELLRLYEYVQRVLVASDVSGTDKGLDSARNVMAKLGASFTEISAQDESGAVMENTQQIVAGLTYGKGTLNEADMTAGSNRGFLA
ncbi:MAG: flagellar protein FliS [Lachnospiraceae bacterium]|nr:flagellar protein FliS [Lachnospiraceae bacterium]